MREDMIQILKRHLDVKMLEDDIDTWRMIENDNKTFVPTDYIYDTVIYQNVYFSDLYDELVDLSSVIYNGGKAVGVWPLGIYKNAQKYQIGSLGGGKIIAPLLRENGNTIEMKRKLLRKCIHALEELCKEVGISKYQLKDMIFGQGLSIWAQMYLEMGAYCCGINSECYIDLSLKEKDILERIRRTNKYSIQKADKLWKSEIITKENGRDRVEKCFERFRELHFEVSGRTTRSKKTWEIQCESVLNKNNFVILLYDIEDNLIGASLFRVSGSVGLYSVAAYKRELFKKPVGHISQWIAIKHMKELGLKWYYIGRRSYLGDWDHPSEKEISIGHFKEGFATNIYPRVFLEYNMDNNHFEVS